MICNYCNSTESRRWYKNKTQCSKCQCKEYYIKNRDSRLEKWKIWAEKNKEYRKEYKKNYNHGPEKRKSKENLFRKKHVKQATPKWVSKNDLKQVYYNCPEGYQVDHVIPLRGKEVSGLHVPWNLQYLTPEDNNKKNNKLEVT